MKLIAIDMDGTLLNEKLEISSENLEAIHAVQQAGHVVMICSGRAKDDLQQVMERYELSVPVGASNGAVIYDQDRLLQALYIHQQNAQVIADLLDAAHVPYKLYTNQGIYAPRNWKEKVVAAYHAGSIEDHGISLDELERITEHQLKSNVVSFYDDARTLIRKEEIEIEKFFILTLDSKQRAQLQAHFEQLPHIMVTASAPTNLEVMHSDGHKGTGLLAMAKHLGIPIEDTIAIGDNFNDVPMLEAAGFSIAMGNAEQAVKDLCDAVTLKHTEHGVARALRTYVLHEEESLR